MWAVLYGVSLCVSESVHFFLWMWMLPWINCCAPLPWMSLTDGRCPCSLIPVAFADTPPIGRLPLKQTWEVNHAAKSHLKRQHTLFSLDLALVNHLYPKRRQQQATTPHRGWGVGDEEQSAPPGKKIPGAIQKKCTDYKGTSDCQCWCILKATFFPILIHEGLLSGWAFWFFASWLQFQGWLAKLT